MTTPVTCGGSPPPPPALAVSRTSMAFTATQGGANPAAQTADITNTGGGTLNFTASETASWLTVSPGSRDGAGDDHGHAVDRRARAGDLHDDDHRRRVRRDGLAEDHRRQADGESCDAGARGLPRVALVYGDRGRVQPGVADGQRERRGRRAAELHASDHSYATPARRRLPSRLPPPSVPPPPPPPATDDQPWLSVSPASGGAPAALSAAVNGTGLAAGTYTGTITVTAAGTSGSPQTVAVTLTVNPTPPPGGAPVGAWGFDELSGNTVTDASGRGSAGTISGATRTTSGRFGSPCLRWRERPGHGRPTAPRSITNRATIEAWVYPTDSAATAGRS